MTNTHTRISASTASQKWRDLYMAALFEKDSETLRARIPDAENAIIRRARELFPTSGDNMEEAQALDDALYALRALRHCLEHKTRESDAA